MSNKAKSRKKKQRINEGKLWFKKVVRIIFEMAEMESIKNYGKLKNGSISYPYKPIIACDPREPILPINNPLMSLKAFKYL